MLVPLLLVTNAKLTETAGHLVQSIKTTAYNKVQVMMKGTPKKINVLPIAST